MNSLTLLDQNNSLVEAGISGSDAVSKAVGMSDADSAALKAAGEAWNKANAEGNTEGMKAAHAQAEEIRIKYGYSGGDDGSAYIPLPNKGGSGSSSGSGKASGSSNKGSNNGVSDPYKNSEGKYMTSHGYNPEDYELTSIGHGSCTLESSPTVWYHAFCLREYANPNHEININVPCYKTESHITCELLSREYGANKE